MYQLEPHPSSANSLKWIMLNQLAKYWTAAEQMLDHSRMNVGPKAAEMLGHFLTNRMVEIFRQLKQMSLIIKNAFHLIKRSI